MRLIVKNFWNEIKALSIHFSLKAYKRPIDSVLQ